MAKKSYKLRAISKEQRKEIEDFEKHYIPSDLKDEYWENIEEKGSLPENFIYKLPISSGPNLGFLKSAFKGVETILKSKNFPKTKKEAIETINKSYPSDPFDMTIPELEEKIESLSALGDIRKTESSGRLKASISDYLKKNYFNYFYNAYGETFTPPGGTLEGVYKSIRKLDPIMDEVAEQAATDLIAGTYNPETISSLFSSAIDKNKELRGQDRAKDALKNSFVNITPSIEDLLTPTVPSEISSEIGDLKTILVKKREKEKAESELAAFTGGLEPQLLRGITEYESELGKQSGEFFEKEITPRLIRSQALAGRLFSGDLASSLVSAASSQAKDIRGITAPLRYQAKTEPIGKKYESLIRGQLEKGTSLSSAIDYARNLFAQEQTAGRTAMEAEKARTFQEKLAKEGMAIDIAQRKAQIEGAQPSPFDYFMNIFTPIATGLATGWATGGFGLPAWLSTAGAGATAGTTASFLRQRRRYP